VKLLLTRQFSFTALHYLKNIEDKKETELHEHNFTVNITLESKNTDLTDGMILESRNFDIDILPVIKQLKGKTLNEFIEQPTLENLTLWFWKRIQFMDNGKLFGLHSIKIYLTEKLWCEIVK